MYIKDSKTGDVYVININCLRDNNWQPDISSDLLCDDHMTIKDAQEYIMCLEKDIEDINNGDYVEWYGTLSDNHDDLINMEYRKTHELDDLNVEWKKMIA